MVPANWRDQSGADLIVRRRALIALLAAWLTATPCTSHGQDGGGPVVVVETSAGAFAFETFPNEAPKTVAHILGLVRSGFYDGQRFHRAIPGFVVQWGDPQTRNPEKTADWGRGEGASSGTPIGVAEMNRKRLHVKGVVGVAHLGDPAKADSQIYVTLDARPDLNGKYTVFGRIIAGADVPERVQKGDVITRMYVRE
jgi:peptidyl-prolyl cis-trans isomerase B (cyclophilin B)